jgi:hypothetical protein
MKVRYLLGVILLFASRGAHAQFTPVQAKIRELRQITLSDNSVVQRTKEGIYYRYSDGSVLVEWLTQDGQKAWDGTLHDNKALKYYELDYKQQRAIQRPSAPVAVKPGAYVSAKHDLGSDSVDGVRCWISPIKFRASPGSSFVDLGKACVSPEYDLRLWDDVTSNAKRTKTELYDIKLGAEPPASLFDVEAKFSIYVPQQGP